MARNGSITILLFVFSCHAVGLLLFCKGFLLKRVVIPEYTPCHIQTEYNPAMIDRYQPPSSDLGPSCSQCSRSYKRVVWLLVDALRYDFALYDDSLQPSPPVFRNKLPFIRDLLKNHPRNAKLFKFIADPPTTTMQRLKALTTGSLPTFIDVSSNFNSYEILEDNLIYQASTNGRNVTFMGDDTWLGLYPDMFTKVFPYPSLNVKDLHTVDDGVIAHMVPELMKQDAELVIGHFLGVDHVGHTYGPSHWTMGEKLTQMNEVLELILAAVDEDTVVFVLGDHGMTSTGDHGGETELETEAALLVYSPRPLFDPNMPSGRSVFQIDLVPTVALLLGIPIPFSSLGMIIPEVFIPFQDEPYSIIRDQATTNGFSGRVTSDFLLVLRINAKQLGKYLKTYAQYSGDFPSDVFRSLEQELSKALHLHEKIERNGLDKATQVEMTEAASVYVSYMQNVKSMCQQIWAKFDDVPIYQGLCLLLLSVAVTPLLLIELQKSHVVIGKALRTGCIVGSILAPLLTVANANLEMSLNCLVSFIGLFAFLALVSANLVYLWCVKPVFFTRVLILVLKVNLLHLLSVVVVVLYAVSLLSNSFILYEGDMVSYFLQTMMVVFAIRTLRHSFKFEEMEQKGKKSVVIVKRMVCCIGPHLVVMICIRVTKVFHACRDLQLQDGCEATSFIHALPTASEVLGAFSKWRFLASSLSLASVPLALILFLWRNREAKMRINGWIIALVSFGFPLCVVCVVGFWAIQTLPQSTLRSLPLWQHVALPRAVYFICGVVVILAIVKPFRHYRTILVHDTSSSSSVQNTEPVNAEDSTRLRKFPQLTVGENITQLPTANGLKAALNRHHIVLTIFLILFVSVWIPIAMLLNDGLALSAAVMVVQVAFFVSAIRKSEQGSSWPVCVFWVLMCCQFFFGFGHHATVTSLRFEAAFVGIHGEIVGTNLLLAALLVGVNTIASQMLFGLGLPLLLLIRPVDSDESKLSSQERLVEISLKYIAVHSIKMLVSVFAASLHRRHLMVWWVFTPRFMYEAAFQISTDVAAMLTFLLHRRLANKVAAI